MKITAKRIKKRWIAGGIVIVAAAVGIALFVKAKGSMPEYDLEKGVRETIAWYKNEGWL